METPKFNDRKSITPIEENPSNESTPEKILSREEIMDILSRYTEGGEVTRELSNDQGIYLIELLVEGPEEGCKTEFTYIRKGEHTQRIKSSTTQIEATYYLEGDFYVPVSADIIAEYDSETSQWIDKNIKEVNMMYEQVINKIGKLAFDALLEKGQQGKEEIEAIYKKLSS